jgi:brefeldin A-inhibited guanine nucleotide-exchange protein
MPLQEGFLKNNRGINDGQDLPEEFLNHLFDRIASNEIKMKDEGTELSELMALVLSC